MNLLRLCVQRKVTSAHQPPMALGCNALWHRAFGFRRSAICPPPSSRAWIERVAQAIAEQVERQHGEENCQSRPDGHPRRIDQKPLRRIEHTPPRRRGWLLPKAEKGQSRLGNNGGGD